MPKISGLFLILMSTLALTAHAADGEVRKIDKEARKITLKHGEISNLNMPPMSSMVYQVSDPALLERVKVGDAVTFSADKINGAYTVTRIEPRK